MQTHYTTDTHHNPAPTLPLFGAYEFVGQYITNGGYQSVVNFIMDHFSEVCRHGLDGEAAIWLSIRTNTKGEARRKIETALHYRLTRADCTLAVWRTQQAITNRHI